MYAASFLSFSLPKIPQIAKLQCFSFFPYALNSENPQILTTELRIATPFSASCCFFSSTLRRRKPSDSNYRASGDNTAVLRAVLKVT